MWPFITRKPSKDELIIRIERLEEIVNTLDNKVTTLVTAFEKHVASALGHFGDFKNRTDKELRLMQNQIDNLLGSVEAIIQHMRNQQDIQRARQLLKRLKNNKTRIQKALAA